MMNLLSNLSHGTPDIEASIAKIIAPIQCGLKALRTDHRPFLYDLARTKVRLYCELSSFFYLQHMSQAGYSRSIQRSNSM